jgi:hypothetical protein
MALQRKKTCENGHLFYKSSDCPTCPICAAENKPKDGFLSLLAAPARRALQNEGIDNLHKVAQRTEKEILNLHGIGKTAIPILKNALFKEGLTFRS